MWCPIILSFWTQKCIILLYRYILLVYYNKNNKYYECIEYYVDIIRIQTWNKIKWGYSSSAVCIEIRKESFYIEEASLFLLQKKTTAPIHFFFLSASISILIQFIQKSPHYQCYTIVDIHLIWKKKKKKRRKTNGKYFVFIWNERDVFVHCFIIFVSHFMCLCAL